jgi:hypothetical protein
VLYSVQLRPSAQQSGAFAAGVHVSPSASAHATVPPSTTGCRQVPELPSQMSDPQQPRSSVHACPSPTQQKNAPLVLYSVHARPSAQQSGAGVSGAQLTPSPSPHATVPPSTIGSRHMPLSQMSEPQHPRSIVHG